MNLLRRHVPVSTALMAGVTLAATTPDKWYLLFALGAFGYLIEWFTSPADEIGRPKL